MPQKVRPRDMVEMTHLGATQAAEIALGLIGASAVE